MSACIEAAERSEERMANDIVGFLDGTSSADERRRFEQHLEQCASCRAEFDLARSAWVDLGALDEVPLDEVASHRMRRKFVGLLADEKRTLPVKKRFPTSIAASLAATLVAGLWLGSQLERLGSAASTSSDASETRALREEIGSLREMVALSMLRQPAASERLEGVRFGRDATAADGGRDVVAALFEVVSEDGNTNVRLAAVDALIAMAGRPGVGDGVEERLYAAFAEVDSPLVQAAIAGGLLDRPSSESEARRRFRERLERNHLDPSLQQFLRRKLGPVA